MSLRAVAVVVLALVLVFAQLLASAATDQRIGTTATTAAAIFARNVAAQDDNDNEDNENDGDDDDDDGDNTDDGDGDNGDDEDGDNGDGDDDDDDDDTDGDDDDDDDADDNDSDDDGDENDNDDDGDENDNDDDGDDDNDNAAPLPGVQAPIVEGPPPPPTATPIPVTPTPTPRPTRTPTPTPEPTTQDEAITNGQDMQVTLTRDRVVVQVFASMPPGIRLRLSLVDPNAHPGTPGALVGDLMFRIEAWDAAGAPLATLPAEVNLSVRYQESDLDGRDDSWVTLARLDPADNQWKPPLRLLSDPAGDFVAASISDLGVYAVYLP